MKVSIVTEGFQNTGYGHITRCLSLYQAFEERNILPTFFINGDDYAKNYLGNSNYKLINWLTHPTKLISEINGSDILIIDSYHAGKEYYETLSKLSKISLFIDDYMRLDYPAGIILNGTINAETFSYKKNPASQYLLGVKYIPIRKEFWNTSSRKINQSVGSILITYGGQDIRGLTIPTFKSVQNNFPHVKKILVIGNGDANKKEFEKLRNESTEIFYSIDAAKMLELMLASDIAISAAGQTLYELAVTGTPTIAIAVADNQRGNILEWKKNGFLIDPIFQGDSNHQKKIAEQLSAMQSVSLRKKLSAKGKSNVDGQGSRRIIKFLIDKICSEDIFYLRKATEKDSDIVFRLSNDPTVREQSINRNPIEYKDHLKWYPSKIGNEDYIFLLAFDKEDNFIGQVRFELNNQEAIASISISKQFRGKGLSKKILLNACPKLLSEKPEIKNVIAYIRPENIASIKCFMSAKFVFSQKEMINEECFEKYILSKESQ